MREYPPFLQNAKGRIKDIQNTVSAYITNTLRSKEPNERIRQLEAIIKYARKAFGRQRPR